MRTLYRLCSAAVMALPVAAGAATAEPASPNLGDVLKASGIAVSGAIDVSWDWSDVDGGPSFHQFDVSQNSFSLHQINLTVAKQPEKGFGFLVNPVLGDDAKIINGQTVFSAGPDGVAGTPDDTATLVPGRDYDLTQAFLQYACGNGLVYMAGRFTTLAGAEVINPAGNINASRSLLFFNQPLVQTGARAAWAFNDKFTATVGLVNSSNNDAFAPVLGKTDNNTSKTWEAQVAVTPVKPLQIFLTGYTGNEDSTAAGAGGLRSDTVDMVVNLAVSDALTLAVNGDYFVTENVGGGKTDGRGVAGYGNFKVGAYRIAARAEYLDFDDGTGGRAWLREETLTLGYSPVGELEFIGEIRNDQVDTPFLSVHPRDASLTSLNNDQYTATLKAIYKF